MLKEVKYYKYGLHIAIDYGIIYSVVKIIYLRRIFMYSKDFKRLSLDQLRGKWGSVIIALLCSMLVVFAISAVAQVPANVLNFLQSRSFSLFSVGFYISSGIFSIVLFLATIIVSACITYGIANYMLHFVRNGETNISYIFSGFSYGINTIKRSVILWILVEIFTFLWTLLLIIPGIVASLSYSQAFFILADNDSISPREAIKLSKRMMQGYKWRLFCLGFSFIGWIILCIITFGIGYIFLMPYIQTAYTNFYEYLRGIYDNSNLNA